MLEGTKSVSPGTTVVDTPTLVCAMLTLELDCPVILEGCVVNTISEESDVYAPLGESVA